MPHISLKQYWSGNSPVSRISHLLLVNLCFYGMMVVIRPELILILLLKYVQVFGTNNCKKLHTNLALPELFVCLMFVCLFVFVFGFCFCCYPLIQMKLFCYVHHFFMERVIITIKILIKGVSNLHLYIIIATWIW